MMLSTVFVVGDIGTIFVATQINQLISRFTGMISKRTGIPSPLEIGFYEGAAMQKHISLHMNMKKVYCAHEGRLYNNCIFIKYIEDRREA